MTMLDVSSLSVAYGGHEALHDVSLNVGEGETVTILGANGAGKTTLLNAVAGLLRPKSGARITLDGEDILGVAPHLLVEHGISLVPEGRRLFGTLSVRDNLMLGAFARRARKNTNSNLTRVLQLFPRLAERRNQVAATMSGGEQQMLAIARGMMAQPRFLLLDEPSIGLSPILCKELFSALKSIVGGSVSILLVEQNARRSLRFADRAYLLENGIIVGHGDAKTLRHDKRVAESYLGL